jgi:hypothetical protein
VGLASQTGLPDVAVVARKVREVLLSEGYRTEGYRKAALRRLLHESVAGMEQKDLAPFLDDVKTRFPDRGFESSARVTSLESRLKALEAESKKWETDRDVLKKRARLGEALVSRLFETVIAGGAGLVGGSVARPSADPETLGRFVSAVSQILTFAFDQEATMISVEETLGKAEGTKKSRDSLSDLIKRLARGEGNAADQLAEIERRLRRLRLMPGALMAGAQQSWKGGTRGLLEYLDPKVVEHEIPSKLPGLRDVAVLKEVRRRYEQFWDELDKNIAHYYRGTFEAVYSEKMEGRK